MMAGPSVCVSFSMCERLNERAREKPLSVHGSATSVVSELLLLLLLMLLETLLLLSAVLCVPRMLFLDSLGSRSLRTFRSFTHARTYSSTRFVWRRTRDTREL